MFAMSNSFGRSLVALVGALFLASTFVTAAVGPAVDSPAVRILA